MAGVQKCNDPEPRERGRVASRPRKLFLGNAHFHVFQMAYAYAVHLSLRFSVPWASSCILQGGPLQKVVLSSYYLSKELELLGLRNSKGRIQTLNRATIACRTRGSMKAMARPWRIITESQRQKQARSAESLFWPCSFSGPETDFLCSEFWLSRGSESSGGSEDGRSIRRSTGQAVSICLGPAALSVTPSIRPEPWLAPDSLSLSNTGLSWLLL